MHLNMCDGFVFDWTCDSFLVDHSVEMKPNAVSISNYSKRFTMYRERETCDIQWNRDRRRVFLAARKWICWPSKIDIHCNRWTLISTQWEIVCSRDGVVSKMWKKIPTANWALNEWNEQNKLIIILSHSVRLRTINQSTFIYVNFCSGDIINSLRWRTADFAYI